MRNERLAMPDIPHPRIKTKKLSRSSSGCDAADLDCWLLGWFGVDGPAHAADGWDGSYPADDYCVNVPDRANGASNRGSSS